MELTQEQKDKKLKEIQKASNEGLLGDYSFLCYSAGEYRGSDAAEDWQIKEIEKEILNRMSKKTKNHDTKK